MKAKIEYLETNSETKNIRDFKKSYQPRTNIANVEKGGLVTYFHSILSKLRNNFSPSLNVHGVNDV